MTTPSSASFGLSAVGQIALTVRDLDKAVAFYRDDLGIRHLFTVPPGMAFFDCGGIRLLLGLPQGDEPGRPGGIVYFRVASIEAVHRTLLDRGVAFETPPHLAARMPDHELWLAFFKDPDGNTLALMEEKR
jgi:methylmalonyl-CoA/ethylmalonyl-CoA epimerase